MISEPKVWAKAVPSPRHGAQVNSAFVDGHALRVKNSAIGYNLLRADYAALWPRNNSGNFP
ncbi:MAG: hypothetical protein JWR69_1772 [Pedosphaera sp.]|nr:hypothetical protein [Pedosphaera sp.]